MQKRELGRQGLAVSMEGLGCMGMSAFYGPSLDEDNLSTIRRALELGVDFFDTAEIYGPFTNERLLGRAFKGQRDRMTIATKVGSEVTDDGQRLKVNGRPEYIRKAIERSLRNLGTDYVDLYYLHRIDPDVPIEDSIGTLAHLVHEGKVRFIGVSEASPETIRRAHAEHPLSAVQTEYSLFERSVEVNGVLETCRQLGIGFVAYSPLGRGMLSGRVSIDDLDPGDFRRTNPRWVGENLTRNLQLVEEVRRIGARNHMTPAQLALAWVLAQGVVAIPGTRRLRYLEENVAAADMVLHSLDFAALEAATPVGAAAGDRYAPEGMKAVFR